jgi:cytochrome c oxidase subunit II
MVPIPPTAVDWNHFFNVAGWTADIAVIITIGAMIIFTLRFRERKGQKPFIAELGLHRSRARDSVIFAAISITLLFTLSVLSFTMTPNARFLPNTTPDVVINVDAYQWDFKFFYPNGANVTHSFYVPEKSTILFNVTSLDVMHNFYLVDFRVSIDAIDGRHNPIWVQTPAINGNDTSTYKILCKELCGPGHAEMSALMNVVSQTTYDQWLSNLNSTRTGG